MEIGSRMIRCEQCKHFVFKDIDITHCSHCDKELTTVLEVITDNDSPPQTWTGYLLSWIWKK